MLKLTPDLSAPNHLLEQGTQRSNDKLKPMHRNRTFYWQVALDTRRAGRWGRAGLGGLAWLLTAAFTGYGATMTDSFSARPVVTGAATVFTGDSTGAGVQTDEPDHGGNRRRSVWGAWTAPANGNVVLDTIGSDFNTVLAIYVGNDLKTLRPVAQNDDLSSEFLDSRVRFPTEAGMTYAIAVDGSPNNANGDGSVRVNVAFTAADQPGAQVGTDAFATRPTMEGLRALGVCNTAFFTFEVDEPGGFGERKQTACEQR